MSQIPISSHPPPPSDSDTHVGASAETIHKSSVNSPHDSDPISILDLLVVLAKHKKILIGVPFVAGFFAAIVTLFMPNIYTATTKILTPQQTQSSAAAVLGQLGAIAGVGGSQLGIRNPNDVYVGILKSRTIADALIERFNLKDVYKQDTVSANREALQQATNVTSGKDSLIAIEVDDKNPVLAAALANAYVAELYKLTQTLAITEASQRRLFFEKQLNMAKKDLEAAELALRKTQETTGIIRLDDQGRAIIESVARLQAQIAAKEVQIGAMRSFATENNPDLVLNQQELNGLKAQLARLERDRTLGSGNIFVPTGKIPEAGLEYARNFRNVKYYETIFELLARQFELAKIDEARDGRLIQVLDEAVPPEKKSRPRRSLTVLLAALVAAFFTLVYVSIKEALRRARGDPQQAARLDILREHLRRRRP